MVVERGQKAQEGSEERGELRLARGSEDASPGQLPVVLEDRVAEVPEHEVVLALTLRQLGEEALRLVVLRPAGAGTHRPTQRGNQPDGCEVEGLGSQRRQR